MTRTRFPIMTAALTLSLATGCGDCARDRAPGSTTSHRRPPASGAGASGGATALDAGTHDASRAATDADGGRLLRSAWSGAGRLDHASHPVPPDAPSIIVHAPAHLDVTRPLQLVVFLHGWRGCSRLLVAAGRTACRPGGKPARRGWGLAAAHDRAGTGSVLLVPQLAWMARDGSPGRFSQNGFARSWLREVLDELVNPRFGTDHTLADVGAIHLVAHSAGYETALAILEHGRLDGSLKSVVLMDALYSKGPRFGRWLRDGNDRKLISLFTGGGDTRKRSLALARRLKIELGHDAVARPSAESFALAARKHRMVAVSSPHPHGAIPVRHLPQALRSLGLRSRGIQ